MYIRKATHFFVVILLVLYIFIHTFLRAKFASVGMPTENAYFFEHLFSSHLGLACALLVEINIFPKFVVIFTDYACRTYQCYISILLTFIAKRYMEICVKFIWSCPIFHHVMFFLLRPVKNSIDEALNQFMTFVTERDLITELVSLYH